MKKVLSIVLLLLTTGGLHAQLAFRDSIFVLPDTVRPFTIENFYELVIRYHPVASQAELISEVARQEIRLARGNFDPKLEAEYLLKHYNGTEYYRLFDGNLKFPTASPVTPVVGIERNKGQYVSGENYISPTNDYRQFYAGIAVPLGRGLLTDDRRTALKQALLFRELNEAEQVKIINKLLLDAAKDYWQWYFNYYDYRVALNNRNIAQEIFNRVKLNFLGGESAQIDTVQAKITLLEREVNQQEALVAFKNSTLLLSTYLWDSAANPVELALDYAPVAESDVILLASTTLEELLNQAQANHPELRKVNIKLQQLELDRRLAAEFLKPKLDVSYYLLDQPITGEGTSTSFAPMENYKFGLDFSFPIFLRKERAKLGQTNLKIENTKLDRDLTQRQILNDIKSAYNELLTNSTVLNQQRQMVSSYERILNAELTNLENGESDLFKINVQQEKLFNAQSKLIKVIADYEKQKAILYWSAGVRPLGTRP